jgi:hypothetical protein
LKEVSEMAEKTKHRSTKQGVWSQAQVRRTAARIVLLEAREVRFEQRAKKTGDPRHLQRLDETRAVIDRVAREVIAAGVASRIRDEVRARRARRRGA